jgi:hypothetical protein
MNDAFDDRPAVWSSAQWVAYFQANAAAVRPVPWERGSGMSSAEVAAIAPSLRGWQLGETSDGRHLLAAAEHYSAAIGDSDFPTAVRLFIAEEQRHGEALGHVLDLAGVDRATWDWGDRLFRAVRYAWPRMEVWATPVVMVETHALIYYAALTRATPSPVLHAVCEQILADEVPHIRFQCERLAILHHRRPRWLRVVTRIGHRALFTAITLAIWIGHRRPLKAGGYNLRSFWLEAWTQMRKAWRLMEPARYRWTGRTIPTRRPEPAGVPA